MLVKSGDVIVWGSKKGFALEDFDTSEERSIKARLIGKAGTKSEIGGTVEVDLTKNEINVELERASTEVETS